MHLDLSETMMTDDAQSDAALRCRARLVGLIGGVAGLVCAILMLPFGYGALAQTLLLGMGMVVLFNGLGFGMIDRLHGSGSRLVAGVMLLLPLALVSIGLGVAAALGVGAILLAEGMAIRAGHKTRTVILASAFGFSVFAGVMTIETNLSTLIVMGAVLLPLGWMLFTCLAAPRIKGRVGNPADPVLAAHLSARLQQSGGAQLLVDISGGLDPVIADAPFALMLAGEVGIGASLMEACLIADRPPVLHALARAIHDGAISPPLVIRLKVSASSTSLAPPRYAAWRCVIVPAEGISGKAIVLLDPDLEPAHTGAGIDPVLLQRAMHDTVSPFNAGIGYLDMLADPALAPENSTKRQDYLHEAANALRLAHRNTQILGRWLRLAERRTDEPRRIAPLGLIEDVISVMMRQSEGVSIRVEGAALLPTVLVDAECARFAIEVLLRPLAETGGTLRAALDARGLVLEAQPRRGSQPRDALQHALEEAVRRHCDGKMNLHSDGGQMLALRVGVMIDEPKVMSGQECLRQAS